RIVVMYLGEVIEEGSAASYDRRPVHPYTEALFSATPLPDPAAATQRVRLTGQASEADKHRPGGIFSALCPRRKGNECGGSEPPWQAVADRRYRCHWRADELRAAQNERR